jgi:ATP-dependent RNA helicase SUPV3L1/SUV3
MGLDTESRIRNVTAVIGPTNTGKTHLAIERMLGHESGMIGLPLRLLAREVYDRIAARIGADKVALVTGEEKIKPESPRYWVSTVEAMPRDVDVDFLAIDEIQLAADPERGHVFTDRLLNMRGKLETLLLGAATMRDCISDLVPGANFISRPRLSKLTYAGQKKITRLPVRSAIIAFSASEVYAIAELIRRQRGGAAVVLGALSPRTRNAQVALYQSGDVDFLVATDAVGMGLNLDVGHVAFSAVRKFDGQNFRNLSASELAQIAGRAGRHMNDGTFGVTGDAEPMEQDLVDRIEGHTFESVKTLQWRNSALEFSTLDNLRDSLRALPREQRLQRARMADDVAALEFVSADRDLLALVRDRAAVESLWEVCQIPDYRKISTQNHAELVATVFKQLHSGDRVIPADWFAKQVDFADRTDGDIDTLANRIAHIRTWTFVANRTHWLKNAGEWQARTREIEDKLSDALHECLIQRFVDKRTSALMKGMRDKDELAAEVADDGAIHVEKHFVGRLKGFRFTPAPDTAVEGIHAKAARSAAAQVLAKELALRARRVAAARNDALKLTRQGRIVWREEEIGKLEPGDDPLKPQVVLLADEHLAGPDRDKVIERLKSWVTETIAERLKPLVDIQAAEDVTGLARGIAFRLVENFGALKREDVSEEVKTLDQTARSQLRKYGVRFGAFNIYFPLLLKPAAADLKSVLWALKNAGQHGLSLDALPEAPRPGLTSVPSNPQTPEAFYRACGYQGCGPRVVRIDMLERLADTIRPLLAWRTDPQKPAMPPKGATGDGAFTVTPEMMSILGCSTEELGNVLKALGFRVERRPLKARKETVSADAAAVTAAPTPEPSGVSPIVAAALAATAAGEAALAPAAAPAVADSPVAEVAPAPAPATAPTASAGDAADGAPTTPASPEAPQEQQFEEIWRPRRRHREHHQQRDGKDGAREGGERVGRGQRQGQRQGWRPRGDRRPGQPGQSGPGGRPAAAGTGQDGAPAGAASAASDNRPDPGRSGPPAGGDRPDRRAQQGRDGAGRDRDGKSDGPRKFDRRPDNRDKGRDQRDRDRPRDRGRGDDRSRRDERAPLRVQSAPPQRSGGFDPDSPFAKLSALKQAMEKRETPERGS